MKTSRPALHVLGAIGLAALVCVCSASAQEDGKTAGGSTDDGSASQLRQLRESLTPEQRTALRKMAEAARKQRGEAPPKLVPDDSADRLDLDALRDDNTVESATPGRKAWRDFGRAYQIGYVIGFLEMVRLARNTDPMGYIDRTIPTWPQGEITPMDWFAAVKAAERSELGRDASPMSLMFLAVDQLAEVHGKPLDTETRLRLQATSALGRMEEAGILTVLDPSKVPIPTKYEMKRREVVGLEIELEELKTRLASTERSIERRRTKVTPRLERRIKKLEAELASENERLQALRDPDKDSGR